MSIELMAKVWTDGPRSQGQTLVLLALADRANKHGECWPSLAEISERGRCDVRSARRHLKALEAGGWLEVGVHKGPHGVNRYRLHVPPRPPLDLALPRVNPPPKPTLPSGSRAPSPADNPPPGNLSASPVPDNLSGGDLSGSGDRTGLLNPGAQGSGVRTPGVQESGGTVNEPSGNRQGRAQARDLASPPPPPSAIKEEAPPLSSAKDRATYRERILAAIGVDQIRKAMLTRLGGTADMALAQRWLTEWGVTEDEVVAVVTDLCASRRVRDPAWCPKAFSWIEEHVAALVAAKTRPLAPLVAAPPRPTYGAAPRSADDERARKIAEWNRIANDPGWEDAEEILPTAPRH